MSRQNEVFQCRGPQPLACRTRTQIACPYKCTHFPLSFAPGTSCPAHAVATISSLSCGRNSREDLRSCLKRTRRATAARKKSPLGHGRRKTASHCFKAPIKDRFVSRGHGGHGHSGNKYSSLNQFLLVNMPVHVAQTCCHAHKIMENLALTFAHALYRVYCESNRTNK